MLRLLKNKRAQNTIEYALIIAVVIGAFTAMQLYNRRAISMRVKQGMDRVPFAIMGLEAQSGGPGGTAGTSMIQGPDDPEPGASIFGKADDTQYEPYYYAKGQYDMTTNSTEGREDTIVDGKGQTGTRDLKGQTTQRTGKQEVTGWTDKD